MRIMIVKAMNVKPVEKAVKILKTAKIMKMAK